MTFCTSVIILSSCIKSCINSYHLVSHSLYNSHNVYALVDAQAYTLTSFVIDRLSRLLTFINSFSITVFICHGVYGHTNTLTTGTYAVCHISYHLLVAVSNQSNEHTTYLNSTRCVRFSSSLFEERTVDQVNQSLNRTYLCPQKMETQCQVIDHSVYSFPIGPALSVRVDGVFSCNFMKSFINTYHFCIILVRHLSRHVRSRRRSKRTTRRRMLLIGTVVC